MQEKNAENCSALRVFQSWTVTGFFHRVLFGYFKSGSNDVPGGLVQPAGIF
jgi:hypothetical protein